MKNSNENGRAPIIALAGIAALLTISILTAQTVRRDLVLDGNGTVVAPSGFWATNAASITNAVGTNYATRAQGILAASALQAGASWTNISGLGTAATNAASVFAPASGSTNYATTNDSRFPTSAQKAAMVGSSGSPASTNVFVTAIDPVNTNSRPPTGSASGDLFGSYPSPTLATNGVTAGTYGSQTNVPVFVIDAKGRVSSASASATITPASIGAATAALGARAASPLQTNTSWTNISGLGTSATNAASAFVPSTRTINSVDLSANRSLNDIGAASVRLIKTTDFNADINGRYTVSGTATVTDPAGTTAGQIYSVVIGSGTATIGGVAYAPSRVEVIREYSGSAWVTLSPVFADNTTLNGTANTAPNELSASDSSLLTRINADGRYIDKLKTIQLNPACASLYQSAGGAANAGAGGFQLMTSTTASSYAGAGFPLMRLTGQAALSFSDRIILSTTYSGSPRSGLAVYFQIGKTFVDSSQLNKKGFGLSITLSGVTPYVHNGTSLTSGSTYSASAYNRFVLDFRPGVSLDLYGVTYKGVSTLLGSVSTGLPAGTGITNDTTVDFVASDSGSGGTGAYQWFSNMMISFQ